MENKVSVVVVTYRRLETLERILKAWLEQTDDVWLADSSNKFETSLPIHHVRFNPDPGNRTWHAIALLTDGEFVIKACDDVLPQPGLINDLLDGQQKIGDGMVGIYGRKFNGAGYYKNTWSVSAANITSPQQVGFIGNTTLSLRKYLAFDLKGCLTPIEDIFWHMKAFPDVPKWVVPTKKFTNLAESSDENCLTFNKEARDIREKFYREYYLKGLNE